jgi:hypothetical protein
LLLLLLLHLCSPAQSRLPENATARSTQTRHSRTSPTTDDPVTRCNAVCPRSAHRLQTPAALGNSVASL